MLNVCIIHHWHCYITVTIVVNFWWLDCCNYVFQTLREKCLSLEDDVHALNDRLKRAQDTIAEKDFYIAVGWLKMQDVKMKDHQNCRAWNYRTWNWRTNLQYLKLQDMKMTDQIARHEIARHEITRQEFAGHENAGHENAGHENDGPKMTPGPGREMEC